MTPAESEKLSQIHATIFGGFKPAGGSTMIHDTQGLINKVQARVNQVPTAAAIAAAVVDALPPSGGGNVDVHAIAKAVADLLAARLVS